MIKSKHFLVSFKVLFGVLALIAILTEILTLMSRGVFNPGNFFSFFTIESNIFAAIILLISAYKINKKSRYSANFNLVRGAATLYMITTGVVFSLLLSNLPADLLTAVPWDNTVLHYIMPVVLLIDWIIDPPKKQLRFKNTLLWLIFPLLYILYSLFRGLIVHWYPYPFLDPSTNGYGGILLTSLGISFGVLLFSWCLNRIYKK